MRLDEHPGYFGITSKGVIAIHADWPTFPFEHGWEQALLAFGSLPRETSFFQIDDIDQCLLFVAGVTPPKQDPYDSRRFSHVAAWHEDVVELVDRAYIDGVDLVSEYSAAIDRWNRFKSCSVELEPGKLVLLDLPARHFDEDLYSMDKRVPVCSKSGLRVTNEGMAALRTLLIAELTNAPKAFREHVEPVLAIEKTDSAVREGCVLLESTMREKIRSSQYGQDLVAEFCNHLLEDGAIPAIVKPFRAELRNAFRYIRNDYMQNLRPIELDESKALLMRIARLYSIVTTALGGKA